MTGLDLNMRRNEQLKETTPSITDPELPDNLECLIEKGDSGTLFSFRKDVVLIFVFVALILIIQLTPFKQYAAKAPEFCQKIREYGILAPFIFTIGVVLLVCIGVPRLLLCPLGGMAFGVFWGVIYCVTGTVVAYYFIFLFIRWKGHNLIDRYYPKLKGFNHLLGAGGVPAVILARQLPIHGMFVNLLLGVSSVRQRDFLIGTSIGLFPEAIPFTLIGKGMKQGSLGESTIYIVMAVVVLAVLWLGTKLWTARRGHSTKC